MIHGDLSVDLLRTIFMPRTALHDGAVIVRGSTVLAAGALLPLAETTVHTERFGTRHRAALGITEQTDAVVVVVSEENGQVSLVERARIVRNLGELQLARALRALLDPQADRGRFRFRSAPGTGRTPSMRGLGRLVRRSLPTTPSRDGGTPREPAAPAARPADPEPEAAEAAEAACAARCRADVPPDVPSDVPAGPASGAPQPAETAGTGTPAAMTRILGLVIHNWPLKLGAVALATLLYAGLVISPNAKVFPVSIPIEATGVPVRRHDPVRPRRGPRDPLPRARGPRAPPRQRELPGHGRPDRRRPGRRAGCRSSVKVESIDPQGPGPRLRAAPDRRRARHRRSAGSSRSGP